MSILSINEMLEMSSMISLSDDHHGLCLNLVTSQASAKLSLFGGHVLSFINKKDGRERLWLSNKAIFDGQTPIRGGIPICWPWFGGYASHLNACVDEGFIKAHTRAQTRNSEPTESTYPNHGFVRSQMWQVLSIEENNEEQSEQQSLSVMLSPVQLELHGYSKLSVVLKVTLSDVLTVSLISTNQSKETIYLSQALHTYLAVPDIAEIEILGIEGQYYDKPSDSSGNESPSPYIITHEVDRVHAHTNLEHAHDLCLVSSQRNFRQEIQQFGHNSVVVWNPWQALSKSMADMEDTGYQSMLCIEATNMPPIQLLPNTSHTLEQIIR